ncbi:unnamed protein product [Caenorhabditis brenneri]
MTQYFEWTYNAEKNLFTCDFIASTVPSTVDGSSAIKLIHSWLPVPKDPPTTMSPEPIPSPPTPISYQNEVVLPSPDASKKSTCPVCGAEQAFRLHYGVYICNPCKTFFYNCSRKGVRECKRGKNCDVTSTNGDQCLYCWYKKCLDVGMEKIETPNRSSALPIRCEVCDKQAKFFSYGANICNSCRCFYQKVIAENKKYKCNNNGRCEVKGFSPCGACRWEKCKAVGMTQNGSRRMTRKVHSENPKCQNGMVDESRIKIPEDPRDISLDTQDGTVKSPEAKDSIKFCDTSKGINE